MLRVKYNGPCASTASSQPRKDQTLGNAQLEQNHEIEPFFTRGIHASRSESRSKLTVNHAFLDTTSTSHKFEEIIAIYWQATCGEVARGVGEENDQGCGMTKEE